MCRLLAGVLNVLYWTASWIPLQQCEPNDPWRHLAVRPYADLCGGSLYTQTRSTRHWAAEPSRGFVPLCSAASIPMTEHRPNDAGMEDNLRPMSSEDRIMFDKSTPVLVLRSVRHGGLGVARTLGRLGVQVYLLDVEPRSAAFASRYCRGSFVWDIDREPAEKSGEFLAEIGRRLGRAILIATSDTTALFVAANAPRLQEWFQYPQLPVDLVQTLYSKKSMHFLAKNIGIPTPNAVFPGSKAEVLRFLDEAQFPIMLKPIEARNAKNKAALAKVIVNGKQELLENYDRMEDPEAPNLMLQEYIPGGEHASWMFNGYFDTNSDCLFGMTGRKIRQNPPFAGITSLGVCTPNPTVDETTRRFMKAVGYRGALDIGYRFDARDGQYKVFDVNPRLGCTFRLFVDSGGMDVVRALYLDQTGQKVSAGRAIRGRKWMVEDLDLTSAFRYWRDGKLGVLEWLRSFRGVREFAFFAWDDLRPVLSMWRAGSSELFRRLRKAYGLSQSGGNP
jgi:D-aspartate ligase